MILNVGNRKLNFWSEYSVSLSFDSIASVFAFTYYYDETSRTNRDISQVLDYKKCSLVENGTTFLTGTILTHGFTSESKKKLSSISGYSLPGVLGDVCVPPDLYPLQFDDLTLKEIAEKLCKPFNIPVVIDSIVSEEMNAIIEEVDIEPTDKIGSFLAKLAADKNIVLSHSASGDLVFTKANTKQSSVFDFGGDNEALRKKLVINGQEMFSQVTAVSEDEDEPGNAGESTLLNPYVTEFRPLVVIQESGDDNDTVKVARTALGIQLKAIQLTIDVASWTDKSGYFWKPNTIITVIDKELKIFKKARFFVETVSFKGNIKGQTATLTCVLPEVYNDEEIISIFS